MVIAVPILSQDAMAHPHVQYKHRRSPHKVVTNSAGIYEVWVFCLRVARRKKRERPGLRDRGSMSVDENSETVEQRQ